MDDGAALQVEVVPPPAADVQRVRGEERATHAREDAAYRPQLAQPLDVQAQLRALPKLQSPKAARAQGSAHPRFLRRSDSLTRLAQAPKGAHLRFEGKEARQLVSDLQAARQFVEQGGDLALLDTPAPGTAADDSDLSSAAQTPAYGEMRAAAEQVMLLGGDAAAPLGPPLSGLSSHADEGDDEDDADDDDDDDDDDDEDDTLRMAAAKGRRMSRADADEMRAEFSRMRSEAEVHVAAEEEEEAAEAAEEAAEPEAEEVEEAPAAAEAEAEAAEEEEVAQKEERVEATPAAAPAPGRGLWETLTCWAPRCYGHRQK